MSAPTHKVMTTSGVRGVSGDAGELRGTVDEDELVMTLIHDIAEELDRDPLDLPPLSREIDLEAAATLGAAPGATLGFQVVDCEVFIGSKGTVSVSRLDE